MASEQQNADPLEFLKGMWGSMGFAVPGMVTPTMDVDEIDKRITDLKTVEGWLRMNLNMLQMSIQGLEMQRATLAAMQAISQSASSPEANANPFANPALWPWNMTAGGYRATGRGRAGRQAGQEEKIVQAAPSATSQNGIVSMAPSVEADISQATPGPSPPILMARM